MIIGLSGRNGAGKGEVLAFLQSRSFYAHSLSDVIRDELRRQGQTETRERMIETGNAIRAQRGRAAWPRCWPRSSCPTATT
jgi:dephospho-CoA kinase